MVLISFYLFLFVSFKIEKTNQQLELDEKNNLNLIWDQVFNLISSTNNNEKKKRKSVLFNDDNSPSNDENQQMKNNQNKERMRSLIIQLKND